jgi:hypothetical protein
MRKTLAVLAILPLCLLLMGSEESCTDQHSAADRKMDNAQAIANEQAVAQTGMPGISNFTEKKIVRKLYELRDQNIATFTYLPDLQGRLWHICDSIGYGLPYGVQFTNPHRPLSPSYATSSMVDQAEPNGLFMPPTAEGTWVICASEKQKGDFQPMYVEPRVIVSPFRLNSVGDYQAK